MSPGFDPELQLPLSQFHTFSSGEKSAVTFS